MSDIIRMARAIYGPAYDDMNAEAGKIKLAYIAGGGDPAHVASPERLHALKQGGAAALFQRPAEQRGDGSIAGPYVPTPMALAAGMIEKKAVPAVMDAMNKGINTVSSGFDRDKQVGFAVGRAPDGRIVRVEK